MRLLRWLKKDTARKAVALFFAVLIWLAVTHQLRDFEVFHGVPVKIEAGPGILVTDRIPTVDLMLRGSRGRLRKLKLSDLVVLGRIDSVPTGMYFYNLRLSVDNVRTPPGVSVAEVTPSNMSIGVDRIIEKPSVPVRVRYMGEPREGYQVVKRTVTPAIVALQGASRILEGVREVVTQTVPLTDAVQDFQMDGVKLLLEEGIRAHPDSVTVKVEIGRRSGEKAFNGVPVFLMTAPGCGLQPVQPLPVVSVTLQGPQAALNTLDASSVHPFVDISGITAPGKYRRPVQVWVGGAARVTAEYVHPSLVDIELAPVFAAPRKPDGPATEK